MEIIVAFLVVWAIGWTLSMALRASGRAASAGVRTLKGDGNLSDNLRLQFQGMGPLEARLGDTVLGDGRDGPRAKVVEVRGRFPVFVPKEVAFVTSVIDVTDAIRSPVLCPIDAFQEPLTIVFQSQMKAGVLNPGHGVVSWTRVGVIIPEILQPPFSGDRVLEVTVRMIDLADPPSIQGGALGYDQPGVLWTRTLGFRHAFTEKGYHEALEQQEEARALAVKVAVAVAMADGHLDKEEGGVLKDWITRSIAPFSEQKREQLRKMYNGAMKEAYTAASRGGLHLGPLLERMNEVGERRDKYDVMELCFEIMAADGVAHPAEMAAIREIGTVLEVDVDDITEMRDHRILSLDHDAELAGSVEDVLGLEEGWSREQKLAYLRSEFSKWNSRLNTLPEGTDRENAQRMLDLIAEARKGHG